MGTSKFCIQRSEGYSSENVQDVALEEGSLVKSDMEKNLALKVCYFAAYCEWGDYSSTFDQF